MKKLLKIALILSICPNIYALEFQNGETYHSATLMGAAGIICETQYNKDVKMMKCQKDQLFPGNHDFLIGDNLDADRIEITFTTRKGKLKTKKFKYDSKKQKTKKKINLWKKNLWNEPVLNIGENEFTIKAFKGRTLVEDFTKKVFVNHEGPRYCDSIVIKSDTMSDCYSMHSACEKYFKALNYCE